MKSLSKMSAKEFLRSFSQGKSIHSVLVSEPIIFKAKPPKYSSRIIQNSRIVDIRNCIFENEVLIENTVFNTFIKFDSVKFMKEFSITKSLFHGGLTIDRCIFENTVDLSDSLFNLPLVLAWNSFYNQIDFSNSLFTHNSILSSVSAFGCKFIGLKAVKNSLSPALICENSNFSGSLNFEFCEFEQPIDFRNAMLKRELLFRKVIFKHHPRTVGVDFSNGIDFNECKFIIKEFHSPQAGLFFRHMKKVMTDSANLVMANWFHVLDLENNRLGYVSRRKLFIPKDFIHIKTLFGNLFYRMKAMLSIKGLYYLTSYYGWSLTRPILMLIFFGVIHFLFTLNSDVECKIDILTPNWERDACSGSPLWKSFLFTMKPVLFPFYRIGSLHPISFKHSIIYSIWCLALLTFLGLFVTAVRKRFKF
ncbi:hypothetical protein [Leptospira licerasiae]|uniref:hypothetical protein n=3 Tax=Leptospira TaxID=171 RepID=UPI003016BE27